MSKSMILPHIETRIVLIRNQKVMIDADLAELYGVSTKRLNEQVKRNRKRFPKDFMFQLTSSEKTEVVANCDHLRKLRFSPVRPYAFTEHGALMLAYMLNSSTAIEASVEVIRAFARLKRYLLTHQELAKKLEELEKTYDGQFQMVFEALRQLMSPLRKHTPKIGFQNK